MILKRIKLNFRFKTELSHFRCIFYLHLVDLTQLIPQGSDCGHLQLQLHEDFTNEAKYTTISLIHDANE